MLKTLRSHFFVLCAILAICSSFPVLAGAPDTPAPREDGKMYFFDTAKNELALIENTVGDTDERDGVISGVVKGEHSSFRIPKGKSQIFVIKLKNGQKPADMLLSRFEIKDGKRQVVIAKNGKLVVKPLPFTIESKNGVTAFLVSKPLPPGEYNFSPQGAPDVFCFGVDEK